VQCAISDELPKIRVPVLLVGGDRDPSLPPMKVMPRKIKLAAGGAVSGQALREPRSARGLEPRVLAFLERVERRPRR
jgi:pimeloyl-ACP methyl ester carboxylesterase